MIENIEELKLSESYSFDVNVEYENSHYAAELNLTPRRIKLKVVAEGSEERKFKLAWKDIDTLTCHKLNTTFLLVGLKLISGKNSTIERYPKQRSYFESVYEVEHAIYFTTFVGHKPLFSGIDIRSETIATWVGGTVNQEKIIQEYYAGATLHDHPELLEEFSTPIADEGLIGIGYNLSIFYSPPEYKAGLTFPPSLTVRFVNPSDPAKTIEFMEELYTLFSFITGDEVEIEIITFLYNGSGFGLQNSPTIYYPRDKYPRRGVHRPILFPLSRNLRFNQLGLPEFPLGALGAYFALSKQERQHFEKYVRYRRLSNIEERFLGYFRILETLCFKERFYFDETALQKLADRAKPYLVKYFNDAKSVASFIKRLPKFNASKYNTERCIQDYFETIPKEISGKWEYQKGNISSICKLRNDISHANNYNVDQLTIKKMVAFVETLLVFSLFEKLGINIGSESNILNRFGGYSLVIKREVPKSS